MGMDPNTGQTRPISDEEIDRLVREYGKPIAFGDRHPETGEVIVSERVAQQQELGMAELSRRERRAAQRAERRRQSRVTRGLEVG
jgi:hypothetical protein